MKDLLNATTMDRRLAAQRLRRIAGKEKPLEATVNNLKKNESVKEESALQVNAAPV